MLTGLILQESASFADSWFVRLAIAPKFQKIGQFYRQLIQVK